MDPIFTTIVIVFGVIMIGFVVAAWFAQPPKWNSSKKDVARK